MESTPQTVVPHDAPRLPLVLAYCPVKRVEQGMVGPIAYISLPNGVIIRAELPNTVDVREGDLLTLYTKVLMKKPGGNGAFTVATPKQ